jgi:hypothetical protein
VGRPEDSLGLSAKITVEMASEGAAFARSDTLAEVPYIGSTRFPFIHAGAWPRLELKSK